MGTKLSPVGSSASGGSITPFIVVVGDDPTANGQALLDAYAAAVASTPNGLALAEDNRAVVVCPPALYEMPATLVLASHYVDIVGLTDDVASQVLVPSATATDGAVQGISDGNGAKFYNLTFRANGDNAITGFTFPNSLANSYFQNCVWVNALPAYGMETAVEIGSTFVDCGGGNSSFGGIGGTFSGTATNCTGGDESFGGKGTFSGTATSCTGGNGSFGGGGGGTFSGTATNCTGGDNSFGGDGGTFSGTATNCTGGDDSFGSSGTFSGTATNCTGGSNAFGGGGGGTFSSDGRLAYCRLTTNSFPTPDTGGKIVLCINGSWAEVNAAP